MNKKIVMGFAILFAFAAGVLAPCQAKTRGLPHKRHGKAHSTVSPHRTGKRSARTVLRSRTGKRRALHAGRRNAGRKSRLMAFARPTPSDVKDAPRNYGNDLRRKPAPAEAVGIEEIPAHTSIAGQARGMPIPSEEHARAAAQKSSPGIEITED